MEFNKFLNALDEGAMISISKKQLREAADDDMSFDSDASLEGLGEWYYVPKKAFGKFRHVVVEHTPDKWSVYYLQPAGSGLEDDDEFNTKGDVGSALDLGRVNDSKIVKRIGKYLKEGKGESNGVSLDGYRVSHKITGDFKKILLECVEIVKKG